MKRKILASIVSAVIVGTFLGSGSAWGSFSIWKNPGAGDWLVASNWDGPVPLAGDIARIANGGTAQVFGNYTGPSFIEIATDFSGSTGHLQVSGPGALFTVLNLEIGDNLGVGTLEVYAGARLVTYNSGSIGRTATTSSSAIVSGTGSQWQVFAPLLTVDGSLTASGEGYVEATAATIGSNGRLTVSNAGTFRINSAVLTNKGVIDFGGGAAPGTILADSIANDGRLEFTQTIDTVFSKLISGTGTIQKLGSAKTTITAGSQFTGDVTANGGQLFLQNAWNAKSYTLNSGMLRFDNASALLSHPTASITTNASGVTVEYLSSTITGGYLRGIGIHRILSGNISRFNGVTTDAPARIVNDGTAAFDLFTNGGTFTSNGYSTFTSSTNTTSGKIIGNGTIEMADFVNNGVITINSGYTLYNFSSNLVNGGGSRTTVNSGAAINLNGTQLDLNGALLVNNGTISNGPVNVYYGSLAKGAGNYGAVNVFDGGTFSPGNSPGLVNVGSMNLNEGGRLVLEIRDFNGTAGIDFDQINVTGNLNFNAGTTPNSKFTIQLVTLNAANQPGPAANFNPAQPPSLSLFNVGGTLSGFSADEIAFDLSGFQNNLNGGSFAISPTGGGLVFGFQPAAGISGDYNHDGSVDAADYVVWRKGLGTIYTQSDYTTWRAHFGQTVGTGSLANSPVPEPAAWAMLFSAITATCVGRRERKSRSGQFPLGIGKNVTRPAPLC